MFWIFMYWSRVIFILAIASLFIFLIIKKMKNKEFAIFLIAYIVSTLIRGIAGFSFNLFHDNFDLRLFVTDVFIWAISYFGARFLIIKFNKKQENK